MPPQRAAEIYVPVFPPNPSPSKYVGAGKLRPSAQHPLKRHALAQVWLSRPKTVVCRCLSFWGRLNAFLFNPCGNRRPAIACKPDVRGSASLKCFIYEETPAIRSPPSLTPKPDMERPKPRSFDLRRFVLVGKTEVAIRSGVQGGDDGKQAAVRGPQPCLRRSNISTASSASSLSVSPFASTNSFALRTRGEQARVVKVCGGPR